MPDCQSLTMAVRSHCIQIIGPYHPPWPGGTGDRAESVVVQFGWLAQLIPSSAHGPVNAYTPYKRPVGSPSCDTFDVVFTQSLKFRIAERIQAFRGNDEVLNAIHPRILWPLCHDVISKLFDPPLLARGTISQE